MRIYKPIKIKDTISINKFFVIEYYESSRLSNLDVDIHNFWEFAYIDSGKIYCNIDSEMVELQQNDLLLISPNTLHQYLPKGNESATVLFLGFYSNSAVLKTIQGHHKADSEIKELLSKIILEIRSTFTFVFNTDIHIIDNPQLGGQQMTKTYLIELLLILARKKRQKYSQKSFVYVLKTENDLTNKILSYLENNLYNKLTLDDLSNRLFYSKSYLNRIFKQYINKTIKEHFNYLKINEAKKLLRFNHQLSVTEISNLLKFDTPSYFIKVFKKYTNLTPIEYKEKILLNL